MCKRFSISAVFTILMISSYSQDSLIYRSKWQTHLSVGVIIPITKLLDGNVTDNLIEFDDQSYYLQFISVSYFFHKHWGVEFNYQGCSSNQISTKGNNFIQSMKSEYGEEYFVSPSTGATIDNYNIISGNFDRGFIGIIYRFESNHIFFYPKFSLGVTSFYTDWGMVFLKEKNSNGVTKVSYTSGNRPNDNFIIAPALSIGYKLSKRFSISADLQTSYYKTDITFVKTTSDLFTGLSVDEQNEYKKNIFNFSLGMGILFTIK